MDSALRILVLEDSPIDAELMERELRKSDIVFSSRRVENRETFLRELSDFAPNLILADYKLPQFDGVTALKLAQETDPLISVIIVTGSLNEEIAVECMKAGAADYVLKESLTRLGPAVRSALEKRRMQQEKQQAEAALKRSHDELEQRVKDRTLELSTANAELERASRLKDEFLANMSHELRTPLNSILGMSEVLHEDIYGPLNPKQRRSVGTIEESGRHLLSLINDILDLSKISAGMFELDVTVCPVASVCQVSVRFVKQMALKKQIRVQVRIDNAPATIQADQRRLKQMLVNLLTNAVKFTPEGGRIGLDVDGHAADGTVTFTVWDTGPGISEDEAARLFQPFVQLNQQQPGTGLGLSLVYRMAEMHGGSVTLESTVGEGSRFTVLLPWQEIDTSNAKSFVEQPAPVINSRSPTTDNQQSTINNQQSKRVLIADDNPENIQTFASYLSMKDYRLIIAQNGQEALNAVEKGRPDIILMDVQMPVMGGLEAIRQLRADTDADVQAIPIIALTALAMPGDQEKCLSAGANAYLSKPVNLQQLCQLIEDLLKSDT